MSKREQAIRIIDNFDERRLDAFLTMFGGLYPYTAEEECSQEERDAAFERIDKLVREKIKPAPPGFDYKEELYSYLDERYGV